ncbi:MAG: aminotransferase class V-fold PLP-dependent enzyme [Nocardioidaceae bacterium]|nr:aminotransferase class V-fold PLP-dependent enzyme [Nocardioidaceae bacterium]
MFELWDADPGYLNTATYGLPPRTAWEALQGALDDWRGGCASFDPWIARVEDARASFGRLVGVAAERVSVGSTVSAFAGFVGAALPDNARVLVPEGEFTSLVFPWAVHADRGVTVVQAPLEELADAVTADTTLVAVSAVQSADGRLADLDAIQVTSEAVGAWLVVDATQAVGWLPVSADPYDAVLVSAYKWLMSPRGTAFATWSPRLAEILRPLAAGWFAGEDVSTSYYGLPLRLADNARRFDISPAWHNWVGTAAALDVIESIGLEEIHRHDVRLANRFRAGLGLVAGDSAIVSAQIPDATARLERANIRAASRAGSLRVSFHAYNTDADVDRALDALVG